MKITNVFFHELGGSSSMKAFANVELDGQIVIKGFKVFEGKNGPFVKVPQEKNGDEYFDTIRFTDKAFYEKDAEPHPLLQGILKRWQEHAGASGGKQTPSAKKNTSQAQGAEEPW